MWGNLFMEGATMHMNWSYRRYKVAPKQYRN